MEIKDLFELSIMNYQSNHINNTSTHTSAIINKSSRFARESGVNIIQHDWLKEYNDLLINEVIRRVQYIPFTTEEQLLADIKKIKTEICESAKTL